MTRQRMVVTLGTILTLAAAGLVLLYWRLDQKRTDLGLEAGKALLNLLLIGIAAMVARAVVDQYADVALQRLVHRQPALRRLDRLLHRRPAHRSDVSLRRAFRRDRADDAVRVRCQA